MRASFPSTVRLVLLLAALAAVMVAVAACGNGDDGDEASMSSEAAAPEAPQTTEAAATPIAAVVAIPETAPVAEPTKAPEAMAMTDPKVSRVVFGTNMPQENTSPPLGGGGISGFIALRPMYEYLVDITPDKGQFVPMLATEWSIEGNDKIRYKLREGVPFHKDNGEFTAKDVVHTWEQVTREAADHGNSRLFRAATDHIEIVNDYEVLWHLTSPEAELFWIISQMSAGGMEIQSADHFAELSGGDPEFIPEFNGEAVAGTGAYQFQSRSQAENIRFERVPYDHWQTRADFPEFEWRIINENSTRLAALLAKEIHITNLPADLQEQAEGQGMKSIAGRVKGLRTFMSFNCCYTVDASREFDAKYTHPDSPLLDDRVRKAINKAIDKDALNEAFFKDKAFPMYHTHLNENTLGWNDAWQTDYEDEYGFDPAAARSLLREAGYDSSNPLEFTTYSREHPVFAGGADLVDIAVGYWSDVGIKVNLEIYDPTRVGGMQRGGELTNHIVLEGSSSYPFVAQRIYNWTYSSRSSRYTSPLINVLGTKVRGLLDPEEQAKAWRDWGNEIYYRHGNVNLFWLPAEAIVNPDVVEDWVFPSNVTGTWTHIYNIKGVR